MATKTTKVKSILDYANSELAAVGGFDSNRAGIITMLEMVLHESGNYNGFMFLDEKDLGAGTIPGIYYDSATGAPVFEGTDSTRRKYF